MNKKAHKNQNLYIKERIGITGLVMSVVLLFIFLIMMLVPYFSNRNTIDYTYENVSKPLVTQSMNYLYGHASEQDIQNATSMIETLKIPMTIISYLFYNMFISALFSAISAGLSLIQKK